jgi:SAM-dependent methyltransferase
MVPTNVDLTAARSLIYDRLVEQIGNLGDSHLWLASQVPAGTVVLDVGCAGGYLAEVLVKKGCVVDGIEIDVQAATRARRVCREVFVGSVEEEDFVRSLTGGYDRILFGDVLEHLREPENVLRRIAALLNADGRILVSLPNIAYWEVRWDLLRGRFEYQESGLMDCTHLRFYTYDSVRDMVRGAGLEVSRQEMTTRGFLPTRIGHALSRRISRRYPNLFAYQSLLELRVPHASAG